MPIDYKKYPTDWKDIRLRILQRDGNKCKKCGIDNYEIGYRAANGDFYSWEYIENALELHGHDLFNDVLRNCYDSKGNPTKAIKIVLTIAHLNHDVNDNTDENLAALCQRCHLTHDKEHHMKNSRSTIENKKGLQRLFD